MIYLPNQRALFVHNPKCAGSSMVVALTRTFPEHTRLWGRFYLPQQDLLRDISHLRMEEMRQFLPAETYPVNFTFAVVRDPYTRFISAYKHLMKHSCGDPNLTMEDLMERHFNHNSLRTDWRLVHFAPQYTFLFRAGKCAIDLLGRIEHLDEFTQKLSSRLGVDIFMTPENVGAARQIELSDNVVASINHYYARDFALFGYPIREPGRHAKILGERALYRRFEALWPAERGLEVSAKTFRNDPSMIAPGVRDSSASLQAA